MEYLAFHIALKDLADTPTVDTAFFNAFCRRKSRSEMSVSERRLAAGRRANYE